MPTPIDPHRIRFEQRAGSGNVTHRGQGLLHGKDANGQYRRPDKPGRNEACECGSGKKSKRCHPAGFRAVVNRTATGTCDSCKAADVTVIPLRHEGLDGWRKVVCVACARDPAATLKRLLAEGIKVENPHAKLNPAEQAPQSDEAGGTGPERAATIILYRCEVCSMVSVVDLPDSAVTVGRLPPRSVPCSKCNVPELPFAARRATSQEFADITVALLTQDHDTMKRLLGDETALGILPGVQVKTIPFAGDVVMEAPPA